MTILADAQTKAGAPPAAWRRPFIVIERVRPIVVVDRRTGKSSPMGDDLPAARAYAAHLNWLAEVGRMAPAWCDTCDMPYGTGACLACGTYRGEDATWRDQDGHEWRVTVVEIRESDAIVLLADGAPTVAALSDLRPVTS